MHVALLENGLRKAIGKIIWKPTGVKKNHERNIIEESK
jgi:hypothetical protein